MPILGSKQTHYKTWSHHFAFVQLFVYFQVMNKN